MNNSVLNKNYTVITKDISVNKVCIIWYNNCSAVNENNNNM